MPLTKEKRKKYSDDWKLISLSLIIERAKNHCEMCGKEKTSGRGKYDKRITLTCAHLDHDEANNSENNLMVLCGACHLNYDRKDNVRRRRRNKMNVINGGSKIF